MRCASAASSAAVDDGPSIGGGDVEVSAELGFQIRYCNDKLEIWDFFGLFVVVRAISLVSFWPFGALFLSFGSSC